MNETFPSRMLEDIQRSGMRLNKLAAVLEIRESTLWRIRDALVRGELPDKGAVIAIYWALGFDKPGLDKIALHYDAARHVTPLRRKTTEHRSAIKAEEDISTGPLPRPTVRV